MKSNSYIVLRAISVFWPRFLRFKRLTVRWWVEVDSTIWIIHYVISTSLPSVGVEKEYKKRRTAKEATTQQCELPLLSRLGFLCAYNANEPPPARTMFLRSRNKMGILNFSFVFHNNKFTHQVELRWKIVHTLPGDSCSLLFLCIARHWVEKWSFCPSSVGEFGRVELFFRAAAVSGLMFLFWYSPYVVARILFSPSPCVFLFFEW